MDQIDSTILKNNTLHLKMIVDFNLTKISNMMILERWKKLLFKTENKINKINRKKVPVFQTKKHHVDKS